MTAPFDLSCLCSQNAVSTTLRRRGPYHHENWASGSLAFAIYTLCWRDLAWWLCYRAPFPTMLHSPLPFGIFEPCGRDKVGAYRKLQHSWPLSGTPSYRLSGAQGFGERIQPQAAAHRSVILRALSRIQLREIAVNDDLLHHLLQDGGMLGVFRGRNRG